jgi:hypothetical protein
MSLSVDWMIPSGATNNPPTTDDVKFALNNASRNVVKLSANSIISALDDLSISLLERGNPLLAKYPDAGLPFLAHMCHGDKFSNLITDALGGLDCLDQYVPKGTLHGHEKRAYPRGVIGHWIAGNVPTLGLLSLLSAMITKNTSLIRLPSAANKMLSELLRFFHKLGDPHAILASAIAVVRYDFEDLETAEALSLMVDTRIIWGGDNSTSHVKALPSKLSCLDVVFPDMTSFAIVGSSHLGKDRISSVTRLVAHDVSVFEQKACASPHTIFLETSDDDILIRFCEKLYQSLEETLKRIPKNFPSTKEASVIIQLRTRYDMLHSAWYSNGIDFTIVSDDKEQLGPAIGNRFVYVRKMPTIEKLCSILPQNIQSVGLLANGEFLKCVTTELGAFGVHRFPRIGGLTHFDIPWDGIMIPQYLVRWSSRNISED